MKLIRSDRTVANTYQSTTGGEGTGSGIISGNGGGSMSWQNTTPNCPGSYTGSLILAGDTFSWTFSGQDCLGPQEGHGVARKASAAQEKIGDVLVARRKGYDLVAQGRLDDALASYRASLAAAESLVKADPDNTGLAVCPGAAAHWKCSSGIHR